MPAAIQTPSPPSSGKFTATILSTHDLPEHAKPLTVQMECQMTSIDDINDDPTMVMVETGPPVSRHRETNSFKFVVKKNDKMDSSVAPNELVLEAPLAELYPLTIKFRVKMNRSTPDYSATVKIASVLLMNEPKWIILNLSPDISEDEDSTIPIIPTLRCKLEMNGYYRSDISNVISFSKSYFKAIDGASSSVESSLQKISTSLPMTNFLPSFQMLLVPTVPIITTWIVALPIVIGVMLISLPFFLPLLFILLTILLSSSGVLATLYFSTPKGRTQVLEWAQPIFNTLVSTPSGQQFVYNTGPRPTPVQILQLMLPTDMMGKLGLCLLIDFIGSSSYLIPLVGEGMDLLWAPMQTLLIAAMFDDVSPSLKYLSFVEEILPLTDVVPTATLGWIREFGPLLMGQGLSKVEEWSLVVTRESAGLKEMMKSS